MANLLRFKYNPRWITNYASHPVSQTGLAVYIYLLKGIGLLEYLESLETHATMFTAFGLVARLKRLSAL